MLIRVLQVFNTMGNGGIDHFIMDRYRKIDKSKMQFDFLFTYNQKGYFDDEITKLGGKIYYVGPMNRRPIKTFRQIVKIVKEHNYEIIHRHSGNAIAYYDLLAAKFGGARHLILHSHNNNAGKPLLHNVCKRIFAFDCIRFACSNSAGEWMFDSKPFQVVNNGIEIPQYAFSEHMRSSIRKKYGIEDDEHVIGHIGRFDYQKNHKFLIEIFKEYKSIDKKAKLMCVGDGFLKSEIETMVDRCGLHDSVMFTGSVDNVNEIINAFDIFCLPSIYEGLPITLIEAQTNGLHCVVSRERVTNESDITGNMTFIGLDESPRIWAERIRAVIEGGRTDAIEKVFSSGYDIDQSVSELQNFYMEMSSR